METVKAREIGRWDSTKVTAERLGFGRVRLPELACGATEPWRALRAVFFFWHE